MRIPIVLLAGIPDPFPLSFLSRLAALLSPFRHGNFYKKK
jgi:hypothetical protein